MGKMGGKQFSGWSSRTHCFPMEAEFQIIMCMHQHTLINYSSPLYMLRFWLVINIKNHWDYNLRHSQDLKSKKSNRNRHRNRSSLHIIPIIGCAAIAFFASSVIGSFSTVCASVLTPNAVDKITSMVRLWSHLETTWELKGINNVSWTRPHGHSASEKR